MVPAQLLRTLRRACELAGVPLPAEVPDDATHADALDVLEQLAEAVDRDSPTPSRPERGPKVRPPDAVERRIGELAASGRTDPEIGVELDMPVSAVRSVRRRLGIAPGLPANTGPPRNGWQDRLRGAHARGLTNPELASELEWSIRTVQQRLSVLRLRAHRAPRAQREPASVPGDVVVGDYVQYMHPDWGHCCGKVLRVDGEPGKILVQDQAPDGAREWWPLADCVRVDDP